MIDVSHHVSTVERRVGRRSLAAGEARTVTISRVYDTTPEDLWEACTTPERLARWFLPVSGDLRAGGRFAFQGNASGTIERCEPPRAVDATWEAGGQTSWVELRLAGEPDGRARFTLIHIAHVGDDLWDQFGPGAVGVGWDGAVLGLTLHVADPAARPDEAWQTSEEARRFYGLASERWARASIAAGTPEADARAAEARTTGFYTGQPA
jgi:uncharacterized protein YndB with AHSA1/START domain